MFTTRCFIRKNTPELRKALEDLGYTVLFSARMDYGDCLYARFGFVYGYVPDDSIDCGVNEDLFLALAALRVDTDAKQWFTDGKLWEKTEAELPSRYMQMHGHKATADELIEHFTR